MHYKELVEKVIYLMIVLLSFYSGDTRPPSTRDYKVNA